MSHKKLQRTFSRLYDEYSDAIFRHCYFRISNRERAIDLMQETFMRTWRFVVKGGEIEHPRAFLYRVANNLVINEYERRKRSSSLDVLEENTGFQPSTDEHEETVARLDVEILVGHLAKLNDSYRTVILMRYVDGLSIKDIAEALEESENNISVRVHRALIRLRKFIAEQNEGHGHTDTK
ncbi:MAG: RNA polymerase sigma factor [Candidatus Paceibacterota bacterium]